MQVPLIFVFLLVLASFSESKTLNKTVNYHINVWFDEIPREDEPEPEFRFHAPGKKFVDIIKNKNLNKFETLLKNTVNSDAQTVFVIHGYNGGNAQWPVDIKDALIEKEKCNVFIVDWSGLDGKLYGTAYDNLRKVGKEVGTFIKGLINLIPSFSPEKVHLVGHSLGAHVSGFAGKWMKQNGLKIGRITGLDPAGPGFNDLAAIHRLDYQDAEFVDVIHTNWAGKFWESVSGFGLEETVGNFDFYPNGGEDQPGCKTAGEAELDIGIDLLGYLSPQFFVYKILSGGPKITESKIMDLSCSHSRAHQYFYWSIKDKDNGCKFSADECPSWEMYEEGKCATPAEQLPKTQMGYYSYKYKDRIKNKPQRKFYLRTTSTPPYCQK